MKAHVDEVGRDPSERKELCMGRTVTEGLKAVIQADKRAQLKCTISEHAMGQEVNVSDNYHLSVAG